MTQKYITVETEGAVTVVTLPREKVRNAINDMSTTDGLFTEGLLAMAVQTNPDIKERLDAFFTKKTKRLEPGAG